MQSGDATCLLQAVSCAAAEPRGDVQVTTSGLASLARLPFNLGVSAGEAGRARRTEPEQPIKLYEIMQACEAGGVHKVQDVSSTCSACCMLQFLNGACKLLAEWLRPRVVLFSARPSAAIRVPSCAACLSCQGPDGSGQCQIL